MTEGEVRRDRVTKRMRRVARIWSFPIILYALVTFSGYAWSWATTGVADPYTVEDYPPIENLPPILLLLSILGLAIAWRRERLGAVLALALLAATVSALLIQMPITRDFPRSAIPYALSLIVAVPAVLLLICSRRSSADIPDAGGIPL